MSTDFKTEVVIPMNELFDGRLQQYGIYEEVVDGVTLNGRRCLTDGRNCVWVAGRKSAHTLTRYGVNDPNDILHAIAVCFGTEIYSEHQDEYWTLEKQTIWEWTGELETPEARAELYSKLMRYLSGESDVFSKDSRDMARAKIAQELWKEYEAYYQSPTVKDAFLMLIELGLQREIGNS